MVYRLLITDVDGTLVDHRQQIPPRNLAAIERFKVAGGLVTLGTGRIEASAAPFAARVGINAPAVLYNGGRIVDLASGRVLFQALVPAPVCGVLCELLETDFRETVHPIVYAEGRPRIRKMDGELEVYSRKDSLHLEPAGDLRSLSEAPVSKFLIIGDGPDLLRLDTALRSVATGHVVNSVRSEPTYLEVLPPGCSKGTALVRLAELLSVSLAEVVAVGDNLNDLEMIRTAGLGVAVANAHPDLKAAAGFVSPYTNEECAVADVIERFCLAGE